MKYLYDPPTYFLHLDGKHRYSIILPNNENVRPGHTQLSRKRIREQKLIKTKEQNKTAKNTKKF